MLLAASRRHETEFTVSVLLAGRVLQLGNQGARCCGHLPWLCSV